MAVGSLFVAGVAVVIAGLTWLESRKQRMLLETMTKSLPFVTRPRRRPVARTTNTSKELKAAAEERRRLRLDLEREKHEWRKNRDIAKALGWFLDRMSEDEYDEE